MSVVPSIKSFLIADMVIREHVTNKWSAIGIFEKIYSNTFPFIQRTLALYVKLTDAEGELEIRVEFCDENDRILALFEGFRLKVPSRLTSADFGIQTRDLPIQKPGKYYFKLYFNNEFVQGLELEVIKISQKSRQNSHA